jgi:hypothetical protein
MTALQTLHLKGFSIGQKFLMKKLSSERRIGAVAAKPLLVARDPSHDKNG